MESLSCWRVEGLMSCHMAQIVMCMSCYRVNHTSCISVRWGLQLYVPSPLPWHPVLYLLNYGGEKNNLLLKYECRRKQPLTESSSAGCLWILFVLVLQQKATISEIVVDWCRPCRLPEGDLPHTFGIMFSWRQRSSLLLRVIKIYLSLSPIDICFIWVVIFFIQ